MIISFVNQKGGVGKTNIVANIVYDIYYYIKASKEQGHECDDL